MSHAPRRTPKISVLLPVWTAEQSLASCLRSIQRQSEPDFECVLIDDGSTDGSLARARDIVRGDARFRIFAEPHEGLVPTLLKGTAICRAPILARMDADDWMRSDRLALQLAALEAAPELDAVGSFVRIFPRHSMREGRRAYEDWLHSLCEPEILWRNRFIECPVAHPSLAIRKTALERHPYRDRGWPEDFDLMLRLLREGPRVGMVPRRLIGWRDHPGRLSRTHADYGQQRFTECRAWHLSRDFLLDRPDYVLWGHGRTGRALRKTLARLGHQPRLIVEVHPRRVGQRIHGAAVIAPEALARQRGGLPIVASVSGLGPRTEIRSALDGFGLLEGSDYVVAA